MIKFDHIAVGCTTLQEGADYVKEHTGLTVPVGGEHPNMGTHNLVMATGRDTFFEVIAIDPAAPAPAYPRWFGLDDFFGTPRPLAWICSSDDLDEDLEIARALDVDLGQPTTQTRGEMTWRFAVRSDGKIPLDGIAPMLMQWPEMPLHPATKMPDFDLRAEVSIDTPEAAKLKQLLVALGANHMPIIISESNKTRLGFVLNLPEIGKVML